MANIYWQGKVRMAMVEKGTEEESLDDPIIDPLQGAEEDVVATYLKGVEEVIEVIDMPDGVYVPPLDGYFEYKSAVMALMGEEWDKDTQWWLEQVSRDWETIQDRVQMQIQMANDKQMGLVVEQGLSPFSLDRLGGLRLITYEQFILESNAGQFREDRFYCDKGRRWMSKVRDTFASYGYDFVRKVEIEDSVVIEVSRNHMGAL